MLRLLLYLVLFAIGIPALAYLAWLVHCALDRVMLRHAQRFCRRKGWEISRSRCQPAFEQSGVKTEFTLVQLDCFDAAKQRKLVLLLVWPFGVRQLLSDQQYPATYDNQWPQTCPPA
jgi:hypothetical protein